MTTSYTSRKIKTVTAKTFRDSFKETTPKKIGYIFLSKSLEYPDENVASDLVDTVAQEKELWDNMLIGKRVVPKDIELVLPVYTWVAGNKYKHYDDAIELDTLLTPSVENDETIWPMFVVNSEGNVYKCLSNNSLFGSQVEPTGNYTQNEGFIQTELTADTNWLWKYMFNVRNSNKFFSEAWIPVPYIQANTNFDDYNYSSTNAIEGSLNKIIVTNNGSDYYHTDINVAPFSAGSNTLTILDNIDLTTSNTVKINMSVAGTGIYENETYITTVNPSYPKTLYLSQPTLGSGGGTSSANTIQIKTRVVIDGDGSETISNAVLDANNKIKRIDVINSGFGYTKANVTVYGSGTGATARAILPPKFGHGYNPAVELGASNVIILSRIGEIDASENNTIPTDIYFREYGLLVNPYKYDSTETMVESNALEVISQTVDLELISTSNYTINEMVYQGSVSNPTFVGYVVSQTGNTVRLSNTYKQPSIGGLLIGSSSGSQSVVVTVKNPDLKPYAGDILYGKNILKVQRSIAQAEEVKFVFNF